MPKNPIFKGFQGDFIQIMSLPKNSGAWIEITFTGVLEVVLNSCTTVLGIVIKSPGFTSCLTPPTVNTPSPSKKLSVSL